MIRNLITKFIDIFKRMLSKFQHSYKKPKRPQKDPNEIVLMKPGKKANLFSTGGGVGNKNHGLRYKKGTTQKFIDQRKNDQH